MEVNGQPILYAGMSVGLMPKGTLQSIEAVSLDGLTNYLNPELAPRERHVAAALLLEDGTVGWFYCNNKVGLAHVGFTYAPGRVMDGEIEHPQDPRTGISQYIRKELIAGVGYGPFAIEMTRGGPRKLPDEAARRLMTGDTSEPVLDVSTEQFIDWVLDTDQFRSLIEMINLGIETYRSM